MRRVAILPPEILYHMIKRSFILPLLLVMLPFAGKAQTDSTAYVEYLKAICITPRFPDTFRDNGQPVELTLVYTVSKGTKTMRCFPEDIPDSIRQYFRESERVIMETDWSKIFPALGARGDFSVAVPVIVRFVNDPEINSGQEKTAIDRLFNFARKVALPYRVCDPVFMTFRRGAHGE